MTRTPAAPRSTSAPSPAWTATQFVLLGVTWGASFLFMKVGLGGLSAPQVAGARLVLGALTLGVFVLIRRERLPRDPRVWAHMTVLAVTFCVVPYLLFAWAEQHVSSGLGSIYNATTPIMTAIAAGLLFRVERLTTLQILGVAVGIGGVVVIIGPWHALRFGEDLTAQLALLGATACYGFSLAYMRRFLANSGTTALTFSFLNIGIGAVIMLLLTPAIAMSPVRLDAAIIVSMLLLGCVGTGVAYIWNQNAVRAWGPTRASTVTYVTPVVGVILGVLLLGEQVSWNEPVGALIVFAGIVLAQGRARIRSRHTPKGNDEGMDAAASTPSTSADQAGTAITPGSSPADRSQS
jgi:drug/metabolite transporter (DMT)-like permease